MKGYHIRPLGFTIPRLRAFVRQRMPSQKELLRRARLARLPSEDQDGETLETYVAHYDRIPSADGTIKILRDDCGVEVMQLASGSGESRQIKEGLRRIVHRHLTKSLRRDGHDYIAKVI
jgi:hypothetical protein